MKLDREANTWYTLWYTATKRAYPEDSKMAGYHERKPEHLLRLAMIQQAAAGSLILDTASLIRASRQLKFLEENMLTTFKWLGAKSVGQDQERIIGIIKAHDQRIEHSLLMRKMIFYMDIVQFRKAIETLRESEIIVQTTSNGITTYSLKESV